jgi:histidinol dehydrogenase
MPSLKIRRIDRADPKSAKQLTDLRKVIASSGEIVTAKARELTKKVFGEALSPARVAERVCHDVMTSGVTAVIKYTELFDRVKLSPDKIRVPVEDLRKARAKADPELLDTIRNIRQNILSFQMGVLHTDAVLTVSGSHELQLRYRPVRRVGVCVPGGAAAYLSTLLMTVVPAQAAGVKEIAVVVPPTPTGADNQDVLAACFELGVREVYRVGGAQAVAALAYGVDGVERVDMIVGPGNLYVTLAKKCVYGRVLIDCLSGPTEILIIADDSARPEFVAADMIAQAEHSPGVSVLVTWSETLPQAVHDAMNRQLTKLGRAALARESLERFGAIIKVADSQEAVDVANQFAPEHLHIQTKDPETLADKIEYAGAIFLGHFTPVALGDYAAGPSHVLPTGATARFASGLTANDFLRRTSLLAFTQRGLRVIAEDVNRLAVKEGLSGHAHSVTLRVNDHPVPRPPKKTAKADTILKARR